MLVGLDKGKVIIMSDEKYNYHEMINIVVDTMSDWFDNYEDEEMAHPALGILIMTEAMNNLKERYCQHDISDMTITAVDQYIDMEVDLANEKGWIPFDDECEHDDKPTFLEVMEPISKRLN